MKVLSIDAWRDGNGWTWNQWFHIGNLDTLPESTRKALNLLRRKGYLGSGSAGRVAIEDDGYNFVVVDKNTREPWLAVEYGAAFDD